MAVWGTAARSQDYWRGIRWREWDGENGVEAERRPRGGSWATESAPGQGRGGGATNPSVPQLRGSKGCALLPTP